MDPGTEWIGINGIMKKCSISKSFVEINIVKNQLLKGIYRNKNYKNFIKKIRQSKDI